MAARKLQTEIDKTIKKVAEGVLLFEEIHDKLMISTNQTQKDKLEADLKTQIKKLQRLRDQIKSWQTSNDIKDKGPLLDNRKLIESQMERFKALEKEMKTKAFSKEGLIAAAKLDPSQQAKLAARHLLEEFVDSLNRQIESDEAEIEVMQAATGAKKKPTGKGGSGNDKINELERRNDRRAWHVSKLESTLRLLENDSLTTEQVTELKEDVSYFVESNQEEDFEEDEGIYDDLNLEELEGEDGFGVVGNLHAGGAGGTMDDSDSVSDMQSVTDEQHTPAKSLPTKAPARRGSSTGIPEGESAISAGSAPSSPVASKKTPVRKNTMESKYPEAKGPAPARANSGGIISSVIPASAPPPVPPIPQAVRQPSTTLPPLKYAAAASAAVAPTLASIASTASTVPTPAPTITAPAPTPVQTTPQPPPGIPPPVEPSPQVTASPLPPPGISQTLPSPAPLNHASPAATHSTPAVDSRASPAPSHLSAGLPTNGHGSVSPIAESQTPVAIASGQAQTKSPAQTQQLPTLQAVTAQGQSGGTISSPVTNGRSPVPAASIAESSAQGARAASTTPQMAQQHGPNALSDLMNNFENVKQRSVERLTDIDGLHGALENGLASAPDARDSERPRYYHPRQPYQTPSYYPQQPHPVLDNKNLYQRMELDTLFFIFYYRTNTYEQWCAAQELKRQSWRFHKQYLTWFQRLSQPQAITDEYEQGQYIYFDWENGFNCRKKSDFRFSYQYLCED